MWQLKEYEYNLFCSKKKSNAKAHLPIQFFSAKYALIIQRINIWN